MVVVVTITLLAGCGRGSSSHADAPEVAPPTTVSLADWTADAKPTLIRIRAAFDLFAGYEGLVRSVPQQANDGFTTACNNVAELAAALQSKLPSPDFALTNRLEPFVEKLKFDATVCKVSDREAVVATSGIAADAAKFHAAIAPLGL